jgi:hypothetical protein
VAKIDLDRPGIDAVIGQLEAAGVTQHVGVDLEAELGTIAQSAGFRLFRYPLALPRRPGCQENACAAVPLGETKSRDAGPRMTPRTAKSSIIKARFIRELGRASRLAGAAITYRVRAQQHNDGVDANDGGHRRGGRQLATERRFGLAQ